MPVFSIITITKNNPDGFAQTKTSVENQTFKDYEWIVIDGGLEPDNGIYDAMNKGIARSHGDYLVFMNAGDSFADFDVLGMVARHAGFDFIYGDAIEDSRIKRARHDIRYGMMTHHQAMFYRRKPILYDTHYAIAADYKYTAEHVMRARTRKYLPFPICVFETGGVSQRNTALGRREQKHIRRELKMRAPFATMLQMIASGMRKNFPVHYWKIRGFIAKRL